jgi:hypothetical protein
MPFKSEKQRRYMFANEPKIAKKWANEYNMGGVASMFRKKLEDGDLSPEIISQIESMAATGADASTISSLVGVSEEQVNNVLMSGSTSQMMPVEGEEMVETTEVVEDPMLNLFQQNDSLKNDQALTTLFAEQEPQGIMAAKGGRIGFRGGGQDASSDDFGGGDAPGPGDTGGEGGNKPSDGSDTQFDGNNNNNNGGNNNPPTINKTSFIDKIRYNPIINNPVTRMVGRLGLYSVNPSLGILDYRTASQLKGVYDKATEDLDDEDVTMNKFANGGLASIL